MISTKKIVFGFVFLLWNLSPVKAADSPRETPVVKVARNASSAIVNISTERIVLLQEHPFWKRSGGDLYDELYRQFFSQNNTPNPNPLRILKNQSIGSGVVIRPDGLVLTNAHVVNMASKIYVIFNDGSAAEGRALFVSVEDDLALVQVSTGKPLNAVPLADADDVMIGETVVAIGNPFGLENSVTVGVVSGRDRYFYYPNTKHVFSDLLQTDASINFGSSGGALLNLEGKLIGLNLAVIQNAQNISFAISARKIHQVLDQALLASQPKKSVNIPVQ